MDKPDLDAIYRDLPLDNIPWNHEEPPEALVRLIEGGTVTPCRALDLGCGAGNYAVYLAQRGFDVTGVDISPTAVRLAEAYALGKGVDCRFLADDVLGPMYGLSGTFGFIYDWELMHHLFPDDRDAYLANVERLLAPGGYYFSLCFSAEDTQLDTSSRFRRTALGTLLYFSSEDELREIFGRYFTVLQLDTIRVSGRPEDHLAIRALMKKRPQP